MSYIIRSEAIMGQRETTEQRVARICEEQGLSQELSGLLQHLTIEVDSTRAHMYDSARVVVKLLAFGEVISESSASIPVPSAYDLRA